MNAESLWLTHCSVFGQPPHLRRLIRLPIADQWRAAIDLAIAHARGEAGYRQTHSRLREGFWRWGDGWWYIPWRVEQRVFRLCVSARESVMRRDRGVATTAAIIAQLERWRDSGQWRKIVADIAPKRELVKPTMTAAELRTAARRQNASDKLLAATAERITHLRTASALRQGTAMLHYTLNTGHTRVSPRAEVSDAAITAVTPLLDAGSHSLPGPPGYTLQTFRDGLGLFATVWCGQRPCISLAVAATAEEAAAVWPAIDRHYLSITELRGIRSADFASPSPPPTIPWCSACTILATPDEAAWMADLERCVAWAWIGRGRIADA